MLWLAFALGAVLHCVGHCVGQGHGTGPGGGGGSVLLVVAEEQLWVVRQSVSVKRHPPSVTCRQTAF